MSTPEDPQSSSVHPIVAAVLGDPVVQAVLQADPETPAHPIVEAVLGDPVVQAVLQADPVAVAEAVAGHTAVSVAPQGVEVRPPATPSKPGQPGHGQAGQAGGAAPDKPNVIILPSGRPTAAPTTTEEEDRATVGQRRINMIWELQQAAIATSVVGTVLYVSARMTLAMLENAATEQQIAMSVTAFMLLSNIVNLVIGFYFGRSNHQKIGGVPIGR